MPARTVIVTGATGALGRAVVAGFQNNGDVVVPVARSSNEWPLDVSAPDAAESLVRDVMERYNRLDIVVHTIGAYVPGGLSGGAGVWDVWSRMIDVNLRTTALVMAAALPTLKTAPNGRFIAVGSRAGTVATAGAAAYAATKAAVHSLVLTAAEETKGTSVTVNAVLPSTIDTEANRAWGSPEQAARWVQPSSIAECILWLASDLAADVSGCLLPAYGNEK